MVSFVSEGKGKAARHEMCYLEENHYCIIPQDGKKIKVFFDQKAAISKAIKEQIQLAVLMLHEQKSNMYLCKHLRKK